MKEEGKYGGYSLYMCIKTEQWNLLKGLEGGDEGEWGRMMEGWRYIVSTYINVTMKPPGILIHAN
jgi:hypothetical protein